MDERCEEIISIIKKNGRATYTELKNRLVDRDKSIEPSYSEPTLSKHLGELNGKEIEIKFDEKTDERFYVIKKEETENKPKIEKLVQREIEKYRVTPQFPFATAQESYTLSKPQNVAEVEKETKRAQKDYQKLMKERELVYETGTSYIKNHAFQNSSELINSDVYVWLEISNPTDEKVGISRIVLESKDPSLYPIAIMTIPPFVLEPQESRHIELKQFGNVPLSTNYASIEAEIKIFNASKDLIKNIPVKLFLQTDYDLE